MKLRYALGDGGSTGAGCGLAAGGSLHEERDFAANSVAGGHLTANMGDGATQELFVDLGELAGDDDAEAGAEDGFEVGERLEDAVRGFVEDQGAFGLGGVGGERFEAGAALAGLLGQEAEELEFGGGQAACDQGAEGGVGAGDGNDRDAGGDGGRGESHAGIADAGHAGIGDDGYAGAGLQGCDEGGGALALVVLVEALGGRGDLEVVFAGDAVGAAEHVEGAEGDVVEVADGGGDEVEAGGEGGLFRIGFEMNWREPSGAKAPIMIGVLRHD